MKALFFLSIGLLFSATGCLFDDEDNLYPAPPPPPPPGGHLISPSHADELSKVLKIEGAERISGEVPTLFNGNAPTATIDNYEVLSANGVTTSIKLSYADVTGNLGGCYIKVDGASSYFRIPFKGQSGPSGTIPLDISLPTNVDKGKFCISFWVYDKADNISNETSSCISVLRLGTGALQVSLAWDSDVDLDLHVNTMYEPTDIPYGHNSQNNGSEGGDGIKDRSDADGYGPENIYWYPSAPNGKYYVMVEDHTGKSEPTNFILTVSCVGAIKTYKKGFTVHGNTITKNFTKNGSRISFN